MILADPDFDTVESLERRILDPECRASRECLLELLHPDFKEHGTSGRVWSLDEILTALPADPAFTGEALDFEAMRLAPDVILLTFTTKEPNRTALRSSVWVRGGKSGWQLRFHQGTPTGE